jgi:hypothetical protein
MTTGGHSPLLSEKRDVFIFGHLFWFSTYGTKTLVSGDGVVGGGMPEQDQDGTTGCRYRPQTWITREMDGEEYQQCKYNRGLERGYCLEDLRPVRNEWKTRRHCGRRGRICRLGKI